MFIYQQSNGSLSEVFALGYSGNGEGKNNPQLQDQHNVGPLPKGKWKMTVIKDDHGNMVDYKGKKAPVIRLTAEPETETFGRDGFLIHGDSISAPGTASDGCVIENHEDRLILAFAVEQGDNILEVI